MTAVPHAAEATGAPASVWYRRTGVLTVAVLLSVVATTAFAVWSYVASPRGFVDLDVYRLGVQAWWNGAPVYGTLPVTAVGLELPYIYPPFATVVLSPLAMLAWVPSAVVMMLLSLASLVVVLYLCVRRTWEAGGRRGAVVGTAVMLPFALLTEPVRDTVWFGQVNLLLMALVALDCLVKNPRWPRGVLVGIAAAIKLTPAIFLLYFLVRKDFRASVWCVVSGVVTTAIGFAVDWGGSITFWFDAHTGLRSQSGSPFVTNQTAWSLLHRFGLSATGELITWIVVLAVLLTLTVAGIRRAGASAPLAMVITGGFGLLASPTSWGHHWVYCVPAVAVMLYFAYRTHSRRWWAATVITAAVFWAAAFYYMPTVNGDPHGWGPVQQLLGNSFTLTAIALLLAYAGPTLLRRGRPGDNALPDRTGHPSIRA